MSESQTRKLYRSESDRMLAGVAGGLGIYFDIDPTLIRLAFVLLTVFGGSGILLYILLWILIPSESSKYKPITEEAMRENVKEVEARARHFADEEVKAAYEKHAVKEAKEKPQSHNDAGLWFGAAIVIVGVWFLLVNFGILSAWFIGKLWPVILILIGVSVLGRSGRQDR